MRKLCALLGAAALASCGSPESESVAEAADEPSGKVRAATGLPDACERGADAQVACLIEAFALEQCDDASAFSSMFKDTEAKGTYEHRTVYGISNDCLAEIRRKAPMRGLNEAEGGGFAGEVEESYREGLIIAMQTSGGGTVIEWERTRQ